MWLLVRAWTLNFLSGNALVSIQCQVIGPTGSESDVSRRIGAFKPLFTLIANIIVLPGKWTADPEVPSRVAASSPSSLPYNDPPLLILTLIVSFIVTWGLASRRRCSFVTHSHADTLPADTRWEIDLSLVMAQTPNVDEDVETLGHQALEAGEL